MASVSAPRLRRRPQALDAWLNTDRSMMRPWPLPLPVDIHILNDLAANDSLRESDAPRFIFLLLVAGVSGTAGLSIGLLYAPAPGEDTREILSIFDEHETTSSCTSCLSYSTEAVKRWAMPSIGYRCRRYDPDE